MTARDGERALSSEQLFRQHGRFVYQFLARLGVATSDLDDIVQEVFLVAHAAGGYRPGPAKPTSYLGAIALRAAMAERRSKQRARERSSDDAVDELVARDGNPVRKLETDDLTRQLEAALATLSPIARATLLLAEEQGESCGSIAASMQVSVGTVYWRLHQARKDFKRAMHVLWERENAELSDLVRQGGGT